MSIKQVLALNFSMYSSKNGNFDYRAGFSS